MHLRHSRPRTFGLAAALLISSAHAQTTRILVGTVHDPLGANVPGATVQLIERNSAGQQQVLATAVTDASGTYNLALSSITLGSYSVRASAALFQTTTIPVPQSSKPRESLDITLATATVTQQITVTATGAPTPIAQIGASVTVIPSEDYRYMPQIQDPLRLVPGLQMTQSGQVGGTSGLHIRGANTDANKLLIDGVDANQIGGGVEFANLASVGIQSIEVLREPNSALYGSDALAGVVSLTSTRATTPLPLVTYAGDAGNFHTYRNEVTAGTVYKQFDLYSAFARLDTANSLPNNAFHNATYAGNFGWTPSPANDLRFTVRHVAVSGGQPGRRRTQRHRRRPAGEGAGQLLQRRLEQPPKSEVAQSDSLRRHTPPLNLQRLRRYRHPGRLRRLRWRARHHHRSQWLQRSAARPPSNTARASPSSSPPPPGISSTRRQTTTSPRTSSRSAAFKYENESGSSGEAGSSPEVIQRGNYSYTIQLAGDVHNRLFYNLGTGLEDNGLFGFAGTPRASLAYYLLRPSGSSFFSGTKLHGSFGKGIKEPGIYQQSNSLYGDLMALSNGGPLLFNVSPLGPETSRTFDGGVDQQLLNGRARFGLTYFHNEFTNGVQNVPKSALTGFGLTAAQANHFPYGAYVNASSYRTQGIEFEAEYKLSNHLFARGGYTYTDAVVQHSFNGPTYNKSSNFSAIPIGADAPLVGARPFRVAPHTGYFALNYTHSKFYSTLTGTLVGRRDDSDFLYYSDSNFGNSLLLPNGNLDGSYQRLELGGGYQLTPRINLYTNIQNLLSEHYFEAFGYPSLPLTFRSGIRFTLGGESWKLK